MASTPLQVEITVSRHFLGWLAQEQISLGFSTYQTNRLFLVGLKPDGALSTFERLFDRPMGLWSDGQRICMTTRAQIWQMDNALPEGELHNGYDRLYVPRKSYTTGDLDAHDVAPDHQGRLIFANTLFSCLSTTSDRYSFSVHWKPPFISSVAPEDRCHLNGLAMENGAPRYITAVSRADTAAGWRGRREAGGVLVDVPSSEIILDTLSMPHSVRMHNGAPWLLNSGAGELVKVDVGARTFEPVAFCPGYLRGLAFHGDYAIAGLSKPRRNRAFQGLNLDDRLEQKDSDARCGLWVVDTRTGQVAHWLQIEGLVEELYDVVVLPGVRQPMSLGFKTDEINRLVTVEQEGRVTFQALTDVETNTSVQEVLTQPFSERSQTLHGPVHTRPGSFQPAAPVQLPVQGQRPAQPGAARPGSSRPGSSRPGAAGGAPVRRTPAGYRFQFASALGLAAAIQSLDALTFPRLSEEARFKPIREPLAAVQALVAAPEGPVIAGLVLAELRAGSDGALVRSLYVAPEHRRRGVGAALLRGLERGLKTQGLPHVDIAYRTDWSSLPVVEQMLKSDGWLPPQIAIYQYRGKPADVLSTPAFGEAALPDGFTFFGWDELTEGEREEIGTLQGVPQVLNPFQLADQLAAFCSVGLRYEERVAGWMITHRTGPETIQYTSLFILPEFQALSRRSLALPLIAEALRRQIAHGVPLGIFQVQAENQAMLRFTRKYLRPFITENELRIARRMLG